MKQNNALYKQKILVSIDTEGPAGQDPVSNMIYGKCNDGNEYGIRYIMDFLDSEGLKACFLLILRRLGI